MATGLRHFTFASSLAPLRLVTCIVGALVLNKSRYSGIAPPQPSRRSQISASASFSGLCDRRRSERPLIHGSCVAPDMNIADASAVGPYDTGARLQAVQEHFVGLNIDRRNRYLHKRTGTTQAQHDFPANLTTE